MFGLFFALLDQNGGSGFFVNLALWTVIFPGFLMLVLILADIRPFNTLACWAIRAKLGPLSILGMSLASTMVTFCLFSILNSYSGMRRHEHQAHTMRGSVHDPSQMERTMKHYFHDSRNFFIALFGCICWVTAWRLSSLRDRNVALGGTLPERKPWPKRVAWGIAALACISLADLPMARVNYSMSLSMYVTPAKTALQAWPAAAQCNDAMLATSTKDCAEYCKEVKELAKTRQETVVWARDSAYFLGKYAAQGFDILRGVTQNDIRIDDMFQERTCSRVLSSVDKNNEFVNKFCLFACFATLLGFVCCATQAAEGGFGSQDDDHAHQD